MSTTVPVGMSNTVTRVDTLVYLRITSKRIKLESGLDHVRSEHCVGAQADAVTVGLRCRERDTLEHS